jgi:hypothetical protein
MIMCDIRNCELWYHESCILNLNENDPRKMFLFSAGQGMNSAAFICPKCANQPEGNAKDAITQAITDMNTTLGRVSRLLSAGEEASLEIPESSNQLERSPRYTSQQLLEQCLEHVQWNEGGATSLEPPRNEKYQGFEESIICSLMRSLDQCIFDYDKEVCDVIKEFGDPKDKSLNCPFKAWDVVDAGFGIAAGEEWYRAENAPMNRSRGHAPITASLRSMLRTDGASPPDIGPSLGDLNFSQIHKAFVSWFVLDVLGNKLDIYELPNMKPLRVIMSGIHQFGEESMRVSNSRQYS